MIIPPLHETEIAELQQREHEEWQRRLADAPVEKRCGRDGLERRDFSAVTYGGPIEQPQQTQAKRDVAWNEWLKNYVDPQIAEIYERISDNNRTANETWDDSNKWTEVLDKQLDSLFNKVNEHTRELKELRAELDAMRREKAAYERGLQAGRLVDLFGQPLKGAP